jgi:choline dehydrogenase-like flavoprotein
VVLACGALNSALLLLRSASDQHPEGLANRSGVVGRHYMRHIKSAIMAVSKEPNPTVFQKTIGLNDFYFAGLGLPDGSHPDAGQVGRRDDKGEAPSWVKIKPNMPMEGMAEHAIDFWLCTEDLPDPDNRITIDSEGQVVLSLTDGSRPSSRASSVTSTYTPTCCRHPLLPLRESLAGPDLEPQLRGKRPGHDGGGVRRGGTREVL